jgi:hypothetical protein
MPCHPTPSDAPFDLDTGRTRWLYDAAGNQIPIVARSRRSIVVDRFGHRHELRRRALERTGVAVAE